MTDFTALRKAMVDGQLRTSDVTDPRLLRAMLEVPREMFVPPALGALAYAERCVGIGGGRVLMQPRIFAKLVQALGVEADESVLDVGCGTGYSAAVLARLAAKVTALESDANFADRARTNLAAASNVSVVTAALPGGYLQNAPYDVIIVNGAVDFVPNTLLGQLNENGRLGCIMRLGGTGQVVIHTRHEGAIGERVVFEADLPVLAGFERARVFEF
jgi:protein-L-isoaspartate(D-aspartate) O-methyltransferase